MRADVMMNLQSRTYLLHFPLVILLQHCKTIHAGVKSRQKNVEHEGRPFPSFRYGHIRIAFMETRVRFYQKQFVVSLSPSMVGKKLSLCFLVNAFCLCSCLLDAKCEWFLWFLAVCVLPVVAVYQGMLFNPVLALKKTQTIQGKFKHCIQTSAYLR